MLTKHLGPNLTLKPSSRTGSISGESLLLIQPLPGLITGLSFLEELPCPEGRYSFPRPGCFPRLWTFQDIWKISRACRSFQHAGGCECSFRRLASGVREGILLVQCVCVYVFLAFCANTCYVWSWGFENRLLTSTMVLGISIQSLVFRNPTRCKHHTACGVSSKSKHMAMSTMQVANVIW